MVGRVAVNVQGVIMGTKGYTYFGAERKPLPKKSHRKKTLTERLREIVAEAMGVDEEEVTDSYPINKEAQMMPDEILELVEIAVAIENEYGLSELFTEENEQVFDSFKSLHQFVSMQSIAITVK